MTIGAAYIRVSTVDQVEYSPEAQKKAILEYALKNKILIPEQYIFIDDGYSGKVAEKRPAFMKMIKIAKSKPKPFDLIIVHRFDRFARNREDSVIYKSLLKKEHDIKVVSVTEQLEDDKFSIILESMLEAMAEYYSLNLSDEVKKGMLEKASRGGFQTRPPYGYVVKDKGTLEIADEEADIVKYIFDKFNNDQMAPVHIAKEINKLGYKTKNNNRFETRSIERILSNPIYMGYIRWNCTSRSKGKLTKNDEEQWIIVKGEHKSIINESDWHKTQTNLQNRKKKFLNKQWSGSGDCKNWLRGVLKCSYCGGAMVYGSGKDNYRYYRCNNKSKGKCEKSNYANLNDLEPAILEQLKKDLLDLKFNLSKIPASNTSNEVYILERQLKQLDSKLDRAQQAFLNGVDTIEEYKVNKYTIQKEQFEVSKRLQELKDSLAEGLKIKNKITSVYEYLNNPDNSMNDKNRAIKSIVNKITVDGPNKWFKINYFLND
ncbi:recombinase family protein [Vallitalea okinawensis]|uniref:recombinase family protein n=1 Tax=Vallitalea okinawensis TaxID=2078660 RepID=UPI000CFC25CC|nr:recombinase family protein [Vallitalea okinawensis]